MSGVDGEPWGEHARFFGGLVLDDVGDAYPQKSHMQGDKRDSHAVPQSIEYPRQRHQRTKYAHRSPLNSPEKARFFGGKGDQVSDKDRKLREGCWDQQDQGGCEQIGVRGNALCLRKDIQLAVASPLSPRQLQLGWA